MKDFKTFVSYYKSLLKPEANYFTISIIYGIAISIFVLAIPISVQALVNTIAFGVLTQPLVVLTMLLLGLLSLSGILKALQTYIIEIFQRRFFIRISTDIAENLMFTDKDELTKNYGVELVNRYFDIMTVQKKATTLLTGGVSLLLQIFIGLLLLAFYHPYFLAFDIILISLLALVWMLFGKHAMNSAVDESDHKYNVAFWLEEIARESTFFKREKYKNEVFKKTNQKVADYIEARRKHFKNLFFQIVFLLVIYAVLSALILGLGGFLVIQGQLSLGQLVAAELIVTMILTGLAGAGKYLEDFYDLFAALSKISYLYKLKKSDNLGLELTTIDNFDLKVRFGNDIVTFEQGKNYLLQSKFYSSKLYFVELIRGLSESARIQVELGEVSYEGLCAFQINDHISVLKEPHFFDGTIIENLTFGLDLCEKHEILEVLEVVDLADLETGLENGLHTRINPKGYPLWPSQLMRLTIAREILAGTKIIVAVDFFDGLEKGRRRRIMNYLLQKDITLIIMSNQNFGHHEFDGYYYLKKDEIFSCRDVKELEVKREDSDG